MSTPEPATERQVRVRRGPRIVRFLAVGAGLGAIGALVDITLTPKDADYSTAQAFGFIALVLIPIGAALGGALGVLLDRISIRRSRIVLAEHTRARPARTTAPPEDDQDGAADGEPDAGPRAAEPPAGAPAQDDGVDRTA